MVLLRDTRVCELGLVRSELVSYEFTSLRLAWLGLAMDGDDVARFGESLMRPLFVPSSDLPRLS